MFKHLSPGIALYHSLNINVRVDLHWWGGGEVEGHFKALAVCNLYCIKVISKTRLAKFYFNQNKLS